MNFYFNTIIENVSFEEAINKVTEALKKEGFGVLNTIDMQETLKNKLNVDFKKYIILGACNPKLAYQALQTVDKIGLLLPCNIVIEEHDKNSIEVAIVDPMASMSSIKNTNIEALAIEIRDKLIRVKENISKNTSVPLSK